MDAEDCIIFADGRSRVTVTPVGPPTLGFPLRIDVQLGPFVASVEAEAWDYEQFLRECCSGLQNAHWKRQADLCGNRTLISVTGDGRGKIEIDAVVDDGVSPCSAFVTVRLSLDQSHLPHVIIAIRRHLEANGFPTRGR